MSYINKERTAVLGLLLATLMLYGCERETLHQPGTVTAPQMADTVLINGGIYTVDAKRNWAEAAAILDGAFIAVGSNSEIEPLIGPATQTIDLSGNMAIPGFHDAHVHPTMGGYALLGCGLENETSVDEIIDKVTTCSKHDGDGWLEGHAFNLALFGQDGPNKSLLDEIDTERDCGVGGRFARRDAVSALGPHRALHAHPARSISRR